MRAIEDSSGTMRSYDGQVVGTPSYMPPEQVKGDINEIDERSDVYSLGAILYEILTLDPPHVGTNVGDILHKVVNESPIPPHRVARAKGRAIPTELSAICMKALSRSKHGRYQTAEAMRGDIRRYLDGYSVSAKRDTTPEQMVKLIKRNKTAAIVGFVSLALLAFSSGWIIYSLILQRQDRDFQIEEALKAQEQLRDKHLEAQSTVYSTDVFMAQDLIAEDKPERATAFLLDAPSLYRGWEWGWLKNLTNEPMRRYGIAEKYTYVCEFSPDDRMLLHAGWNGRCFLLDTADQSEGDQVLTVYRGHERPVQSGQFHVDGGSVFTADWNGELHQWSTVDGQTIRKLQAHTGIVEDMRISRDGAWLLTVGRNDALAKLWDVETLRLLLQFGPHPSQPGAVAFDFEERRALVGCEDGSLHFWDLVEGAFLGRAQPHTDGVTGIAVAPGRVLTSGWDGRLVATDDTANNGEFVTLASTNRHTGGATDVEIAADGSFALSVGADQRFVVSDAQTLNTIAHGPAAGGDHCEIRNDSQRFVVSGQHTHLWHRLAGRAVADVRLPSLPLEQCGFSRDNTAIWTVSSSGETRWLDAQTRVELGLNSSTNKRYGSRLQADGVTLLTETQLPNNPTPDVIGVETIVGVAGPNVLAWGGSGDSLLIAVALDERRLGLRGREPRILVEIATSDTIRCAAFRPSHDQIAIGAGNIIHLFQSSTKAKIADLTAHTDHVTALLFDPKGGVLFSGSKDRTVRMWDIVLREPLQTYIGHERRVSTMALSPDGSRLVTGGWDMTVKIWGLSSEKELLTLEDHQDNVNTVAFSPNGRTLISAGDDMTLRVYTALPWR